MTFPIEELQRTWQLVSQLHFGQKYGGPCRNEQFEYINHIASVVFEILNAKQHSSDLDLNLAINCALLHDTLEDTTYTLESLIAEFGHVIAKGVLALTKNKFILNQQEQMLDSLERIKQQPKTVWAVKLADRICNLHAPPFYWKLEKKLAYFQESKILLDVLQGGNTYLENRLAEKINAYAKWL